MTLLKSTAAECPGLDLDLRPRLEDGVFQAIYYYRFCRIKGVWQLKLWGRLSYSWVSMWLKCWVKFSSEMLRKWEYNRASAWLHFLHLDILSLAWSHYCYKPRRSPLRPCVYALNKDASLDLTLGSDGAQASPLSFYVMVKPSLRTSLQELAGGNNGWQQQFDFWNPTCKV